MKTHIHIFGASGSGTTTIAREVCQRTGYSHFDSDDYFWLPTPQPFTVERSKEDYSRLLYQDLKPDAKWILSGSIVGWADDLMPLFDLIVFVYVPRDIRIERLKKRELERYGDRISLGGDRYEANVDFIEWAGSYDSGTQTGRNLAKHEAWLKKATCPVLSLENMDIHESVEKVMNTISPFLPA